MTLPIAIMAYVLGLVIHFNVLCVLGGIGMRRRDYAWAMTRGCLWPVDVFGILALMVIDGIRARRLK